ncbi:hypothetical protein A3H53_01190 [Candidatus Nomurabacteria bacterium RIFCSPLOWO2_02_FULL_40_10]|uniref:tRNA-guanine(15) transglycosylase-like domain-containing protein n=1 Tax=Candidatus Nomurabacteria bacterium RIFCSPLOWO2_02_FULL_40_10 TaxID=1801786 RepID=A0A1F6XX13_9BACT|nr:MAG: hypothetical protein A3H53_01190 [Candidatus Nomurabacteria bacterium RIFCSPLOWO2_02_FULL_40_10]
MEFKVLKKSKLSKARLGIIKTAYGEVETPALVPVATQAVVKTLTSEEVVQTKTQILIANTYHLHHKPGENIVSKAHGLNKFMNWQRPLMTDSGGFQVFSLGFGRDFQVGKVLKYFPGKKVAIINYGDTSRFVRITDSGVTFRAPDGRPEFLGPRESMAIQEKLGADIIFAFDECTAPLVSYEYAKKALERTHRWARICAHVHPVKSKQALFGIVQGSRFRELREESAKFINSLGFPGFGIGGDLGGTKADMRIIINWVLPHLDYEKPRHLLGIGYLEDVEDIVKLGIDTFDCTVPTHYARRGTAFVESGKLDLNKSVFLKDSKPLDKNCLCMVCQNYKRNYLTHLIRAGEITGMKLLTFHNLYFFNTFVEKVRDKIKKGKL